MISLIYIKKHSYRLSYLYRSATTQITWKPPYRTEITMEPSLSAVIMIQKGEGRGGGSSVGGGRGGVWALCTSKPGTNPTIWLAKLPLSIRVQTTPLASMCQLCSQGLFLFELIWHHWGQKAAPSLATGERKHEVPSVLFLQMNKNVLKPVGHFKIFGYHKWNHFHSPSSLLSKIPLF